MFLPDTIQKKRAISPAGDKNARICIVGDFTDNFDLAAGRPFSGPAGSVLESCLHQAGLIRAECYLTNVIKTPPSGRIRDKKCGPNAEFFRLNNNGKGTFTEAGMPWVTALREELSSVHANIYVAAGPAAFTALCAGRKLSKFRGYVRESSGFARNPGSPELKVIPTFSPADTVRGMYTNRTIIAIDLKKAKAESAYPEIIRPVRNLVYNYSNLEECLAWMEVLYNAPVLAFDIEVVNYEVACISFSNSPDLGLVVPITDHWTEEEEVYIWRGIQRLLGNTKSIKVAQNAIFDIHFLLTSTGIEVRGEVHDTMVGHSVMFTELQKGLGFLGSIYCGSQAYWKDLVKFDDVKEDS